MLQMTKRNNPNLQI